MQKYRKEYKAYVVEGDKMVLEYLQNNAPIQYIATTEYFLEKNKTLLQQIEPSKILICQYFELQKISSHKTAAQVLLVVDNAEEINAYYKSGWSLALDTVQDPGNMGTLIRIADWFGMDKIICANGSADVFNPKVVQSTMGGLLRIPINYVNLSDFFKNNKQPVYAAVLDGEKMQAIQNAKPGIILLGNESKGINNELLQHATNRIAIGGSGAAESLNVAVAAGIICHHFTQFQKSI